MRTTVSLNERLAEQVKRRAARLGMSVSAFIARTLDDALKRPEPRKPVAFRLVTVGGEGLQPGVDLDRPNALVASEDEEAFGEPRGT